MAEASKVYDVAIYRGIISELSLGGIYFPLGLEARDAAAIYRQMPPVGKSMSSGWMQYRMFIGSRFQGWVWSITTPTGKIRNRDSRVLRDSKELPAWVVAVRTEVLLER